MKSSAPGRREGGTLARFNADRGFGFIRPDFGTDDIFVHGSAFPGMDKPKPGARVEFECVDGPKGLRAVNVVRQDEHG